MQPSPHIHLELQKCAELLEALEKAASTQEFEELWQRFLGNLERVWNKCLNHFGKSPKWNGWKGRFERERRIDPLLSYLSNARGAHEHTVADITTSQPASIGIGAGPNGSVHIKHLSIGPNGITGDWAGDLAITFIPGKVDPIAVTNRGRIYQVPDSHIGQKLPDKTVLTLGRYGLNYYVNLVAAAEKHFVK